MARIEGGRNVAQVSPRVAADPGLRVPRGAFGGGEGLEAAGAGIGRVAERQLAAEDRIKSRQEAIDRAREEGEFNQELNEQRRALEDTEDITDSTVLEGFGATARESMGARIAGHSGRQESQLRMSARMEGILSQHTDALSAAGAKASDKRVLDTIGGQVNQVATQVGAGNLSYNDGVATIEDTIQNFSDGLRPGQEADIRRSAQSVLGQSVIDRMIRAGELDVAEDFMLNQPGVAESLDETARRRLRDRIHNARTGRAAKPQGAEKGKLAGEATIAEFMAITGRQPNSQEALQLAGTPDNPDDDGGILGNSFNAKRLEAFANMAPGLADGSLSPEDEGVLIAAAVDYTQPRLVPNPDTGVPERIQRVLPPALVAALRERGLPIPGESAIPPAGASPAAKREELVGQLPPSERGLVPTPAAQPTPEPAAPEAQPAEQPTEGGRPREQTIFEMAPLVAGPGAALGRPAGQIPFTGGLAPEMQQARVRVDLATRDLVRVLQNSPKFAQAERSAIEKEIDLGTKFFDSPEAFEQRLIGMDDALAIRQRNAIETATSELVGDDEREHALNVANGVSQFRRTLLPPRLFNQGEFDTFVEENPPGTPFLAQDETGKWVMHTTSGE